MAHGHLFFAVPADRGNKIAFNYTNPEWMQQEGCQVGLAIGKLALGLELGQQQPFIVARIFELIKPAAIVAMHCVSRFCCCHR